MDQQFGNKPNRNLLISSKSNCKLYTDASDTGLGVVLVQDNEEGKERIITYEARRLSTSE